MWFNDVLLEGQGEGARLRPGGRHGGGRRRADIGPPAPTVQRWCAAEGIRLGRGRPRRGYELPEPPKAEERGPRPTPRSRLAVEDRAAIQEGLRAGRSMREIAADLGFAHTTVSREVRRASDPATGRLCLIISNLRV